MNRPSFNSFSAALATGVLLALAACSPQPEPQEATAAPTASLPADVAAVAAELAPKNAAVEPTPAAADSLVLSATGELVAPVRSELVVRTPGRVAALYAEEGEPVRKGQKLLELETQYLKPELERGEAELARAQAAVAEAKADFERKEQLLAKGAIPQSLHDRSKGAFEQASAAVAAAEAAVALARQRLEDAVLTSPISGVVAERRADVGERLGDNTVAFVLVQVAPLKVRFDLPERHLPRVRRGQRVEARVDSYPEEVFEGRLSMVGRVVDAGSRTFFVEAELPNRDGRLAPGMFTRVSLDTAEAAAAGGGRE